LRDGINRNLTVSLLDAGVTTEANYNPGGVLPEVTSTSWTLFGLILGGLLLLLFIPLLITRSAGLFSGMKHKNRIKMPGVAANATSSRSPSGGGSLSGSGKKPRIKIK
jgi:hypothetical protein